MVAKRPITVCQVLHSLDIGGAEMLAYRLAVRLRRSFGFVFACLDRVGTMGEDLLDQGFPVYKLDRSSGFDWRCSSRLARLMRTERVDLVHAHQYTPFFYSMTSRLGARFRPILFTEHGRHQPDYPRRKRMIFNRLLLSPRDRVVGVGAAVRQALIANEGIPASRIGVLYNGIDVDAFAVNTAASDLRAAIGADPTDLIILQVARLDYLKDHSTAVRALTQVITNVPHARLVLVGDGPERTRIESLVRDLQLVERVTFLGMRKDVGHLLHAADIFLLTSISEGIPLTVIEAMAAGLPVVATNVGGMAEMITDEKTGFLTPSQDSSALAQRIVQLAFDEPLRHQLGTAGRVRARQLFDEARMCADYERLYLEMSRRKRLASAPMAV